MQQITTHGWFSHEQPYNNEFNPEHRLVVDIDRLVQGLNVVIGTNSRNSSWDAKAEFCSDQLQGRGLQMNQISGRSRFQIFIKRVVDLFLSTFLLVLILPVTITICVLIFVSNPGPIIFKQKRVGYLGKTFVCYKFRSMYIGAADDHCEQQVLDGDARVTVIGRWLRRLSLDELPQLYNVIRGDMSLVGPRPHALATKAGDVLFAEAVSNYNSRHRVLPGITGLAQIRGFRGRTATVNDLRRRVEYDLQYIERWSLFLDLKILFLTLVHLLTDRNVH